METYPAKHLQRKFERHFKHIRKKLFLRYDADICRDVEKNAKESYFEIQPTQHRYVGQFNIFNSVMDYNVMFISFYLAMKKSNHTAEEAVAVCFEIAEERHYSIPTPIRWLIRQLFFSFLALPLLHYFSKNVEKSGSWKIKYFKGDGKAFDLGFECKKCGVVDFLADNGGEELTQYCNFIDFIQSRAFGLGWQNPDNIGQGGKSCIAYMKKSRETDIPDNLLALIKRQSVITGQEAKADACRRR